VFVLPETQGGCAGTRIRDVVAHDRFDRYRRFVITDFVFFILTCSMPLGTLPVRTRKADRQDDVKKKLGQGGRTSMDAPSGDFIGDREGATISLAPVGAGVPAPGKPALRASKTFTCKID
jgi:hypothetical protein